MNKLVLSAVILASAPAVAEGEPLTATDFDNLFRDTIGMAVKQNAPIERFDDAKEVGWSQTVTVGTTVVVINAFLTPGTTFTIKHLCIADTRKPDTTTCTSNLGQSWTEAKINGQWVQRDPVDLPWRRDLSKLAFD
jgi:hypothetical protein